MADLIQCPKCGLRQTARHAYCSRCEYAFTGSPEEYVREDRSNPTGTPSTTPNTESNPPGHYENSSEMSSVRRGGSFNERDAPRTDSVRAVMDGDRLVRGRGSLSRRLSTPAAPVPTRDEAPAQLPDAPSWKMPVRQSAVFRVPDGVLDRVADEDPTEEQPGRQSEQETTGRDFMVRGRPQGELYASERSLPPEDPLLADLVAGRVSKSPQFTDEFALPEGWENPSLLRKSQPGRSQPGRSQPRRSQPARSQPRAPLPGRPDPARPDVTVTQSGKRIVAPSTPGRSRSRSGVRNTLSGLTDPGTRLPSAPGSAVPRPRTNPGVRLPTNPGAVSQRKPSRASVRSLTNPGTRAPAGSIPSEYDFRGIDEDDLAITDQVLRSSLPASALPLPPPDVGTGARAPGPRRPPKRTTPMSEVPAPPPRRKLTGKEIGGFVAIAIVAVIALIAIANGLGVYKAKTAIVRTLNQGIGPDGPTADLPNLLQGTLDDLDLRSEILKTHRSIDGATDTYRIGVELKTPVAGVPMQWEAIREGAYDVDGRIRTLGVFARAGWTLDEEAKSALSTYDSARQQRLKQERVDRVEIQRKLIAGDDEAPVEPPGDESGETGDESGETDEGGEAPVKPESP